jgi:hypothetical protein
MQQAFRRVVDHGDQRQAPLRHQRQPRMGTAIQVHQLAKAGPRLPAAAMAAPRPLLPCQPGRLQRLRHEAACDLLDRAAPAPHTVPIPAVARGGPPVCAGLPKDAVMESPPTACVRQLASRVAACAVGVLVVAGLEGAGAARPGDSHQAALAPATRESLAEAARSVKARVSPGGDPAWRSDLAALVREVERVAGTAKVPEKIELIDSDGTWRGAAVYFDAAGQPIWYGKHEGPAGELHGALAAAFAGEVLWSATLASVRIDPASKDGRLEIALPAAASLPKGVTLAETATVVVPAAAVPDAGLPAAGTRVTITGRLKNGSDQGVWVAYGVRSRQGQTKILVTLEAYSVEPAPAAAPTVADAPAAGRPAPAHSPRADLADVIVRTVTARGEWSVRAVAFAADSASLVVDRDLQVTSSIVAVATGARDEQLDAREPYGYGRVALSPDRSLLAVWSRPRVGDDNLKFYALPEYSLVRTIRSVHGGDFWWLPDGKTLLLYDDHVSLWSVETGERLASFEVGEKVRNVSRDGRHLVTAASEPKRGAQKQGVIVEIVPIARPDARTSFVAHEAWIADAAFSPDGSVVATAGADGKVKLWSVPGGGPIGALSGHDGLVTAVRYHPDGRTIVSAGRDGTIRLWDVGSGAEVGRLTLPNADIVCLDVAPDGATVAIGERNGIVSLLDFAQLKKRAQAELAAAAGRLSPAGPPGA